MKLSTKQKQTHRHREQTWGCQERGGMEWETITNRINNKVLLYSTATIFNTW